MTFAPSLRIVIPTCWLAWGVFWTAAALHTKPTRWRESGSSRALHIIPLLACAALLAIPSWLPPILKARLVPPVPLLPLLGALLVGAGLGLAVWARAHLGRNWSSTVTVKEHHEFVRTGPYLIVRHPIYTGLLLALIGTAAAIGEWRGPLAVACALIGILWKINVEEKRMRLTFSDYAHYCKRTAALIPLIY